MALLPNLNDFLEKIKRGATNTIGQARASSVVKRFQLPGQQSSPPISVGRTFTQQSFQPQNFQLPSQRADPIQIGNAPLDPNKKFSLRHELVKGMIRPPNTFSFKNFQLPGQQSGTPIKVGRSTPPRELGESKFLFKSQKPGDLTELIKTTNIGDFLEPIKKYSKDTFAGKPTNAADVLSPEVGTDIGLSFIGVSGAVNKFQKPILQALTKTKSVSKTRELIKSLNLEENVLKTFDAILSKARNVKEAIKSIKRLNVSQVKPKLPPQLDDLTKEARKYKSAEEFVNAITPKRTLIDLAQDIDKKLGKTLKSNTEQEFFAQLKKYAPQEYADIVAKQKRFTKIVDSIDRAIQKANPEVPFRTVFENDPTLPDRLKAIYNQANKEVKPMVKDILRVGKKQVPIKPVEGLEFTTQGGVRVARYTPNRNVQQKVKEQAEREFKEWSNAVFKQTVATERQAGRQAVSDITGSVKQTRSPLTQDPTDLKDISGFRGQFADVYRNFKQFFGKKYATARKLVLDPFDKSKGEFVDYMKVHLDDLQTNIVKRLGINRKTGILGKVTQESADIQKFGEGITSYDDLVTKYGKKKANNIVKADEWFRATYNKILDEVNLVRAKIYPNDPSKIIPKRKDYYRHFQQMSEGFGGLANIFDTSANIPSKLAGISQFTKPKSKFLSFAQQRLGLKTEYDAIGGFIDYISSASYAKNIDPQIGRFRSLRNELIDLAEQGGDKGSFNNMIEFLDDFANDLSGKTNPADRWLQKAIPGGRKTMKVLTWINNRVKKNVILGSVRVLVSQMFNTPQAMAKAGPKYWIPGMQDALSAIWTKNHPMRQSTFLKERWFNGMDKFDRGILQNTKKFTQWMVQAFDGGNVGYHWSMAYKKALAEGIKNPIKYADDFARAMNAGRGIGEVPLAQKAQIFQLVAPFQLEVTNALWVMRDMVAAKEFGKIANLIVLSYVFNRTAEKMTGSDTSIDLINASLDAARAYDEEEDKKIGALRAGGRLTGEVLSNVPIGQTVASLYPEYGFSVGDTKLPTRRDLFGEGDPTRFGSGILVAKGLQDPLSKIIPPFGGGQIKKTKQGADLIGEGVAESRTGRVQFLGPETPFQKAQALIFGKYSTPQAREYFDEKRSVLGERQSEDIKALSPDKRGEEYNTIIEARKLNKQAIQESEQRGEKAKKIVDVIKSDKYTDEQKLRIVKIVNQLPKDDPLKKKVKSLLKEKKKGITASDRAVKALPVKQRAEYIRGQLIRRQTQQARREYLQEIIEKGIYTTAVRAEVMKQ